MAQNPIDSADSAKTRQHPADSIEIVDSATPLGVAGSNSIGGRLYTRQVADSKSLSGVCLADILPDPEVRADRESAFRRGVSHAFSLAGDLVRGGATADDLDIISDLAMDWRYGARPNVRTPHDLVDEWRRGERGCTGLDARAFCSEHPR